MHTFGTAGHVDHGKSTLVQALTGMNPDRLEAEQRRAMTIELGFAWFDLPSGRTLSLIDVPGHERFIRAMLAGTGGMTGVLLVIAADEGVQPQTREHLHIIDLLGLQHGVVVLTRADLVDAEWLELVRAEVAETLHGTTLEQAPILAVSARTGAGLPALQATLDALLETLPPPAAQPPRLPVDRVFSLRGFGTVVTGTLQGGAMHTGMEVELQPSGWRGRIRGLHQHSQPLEQAQPGSRVAVNLAGLERSAVQRGEVLALPGTLVPTTLLDLQLRLTADAPPLEHNAALEVFIGAASVPCHVALLDQATLPPGATGWVQLRLDAPLAVLRGDRCILRRPSPSQTLGGGIIVDAHPPRHRRFRPSVVATLNTLAAGSPRDRLLQALADGSPLPWYAASARSGLEPAVALEAFSELCNQGLLGSVEPAAVLAPSTLVATTAALTALEHTARNILESYHRQWPLRAAMAREELRSRLGLSSSVFNPLLIRWLADPWLGATGSGLHLAEHTPQPFPAQQAAIAAVLEQWQQQPTTPPGREALATLEPELQHWLETSGQLIRISSDIWLLPATVAAMLEWVRQCLEHNEPITLAGFRDAWTTTRRYAQAFLEYTDTQRITRRSGDERIAF